MSRVKTIKIDGNKLMEANSKEEMMKMLFGEISSQAGEEAKNEISKEEINHITSSIKDAIREMIERKMEREDDEDEECNCEFCRGFYGEDDEEDEECNCDNCNCDCEDEDGEEMPDFLKAMLFRSLMNRIAEETEKEEQTVVKTESVKGHSQGKSVVRDNVVNRVSTAKANADKHSYTFTEMIEEFSEGFDGTFSNGEDLFIYEDGTLLLKSEFGVYPAPITPNIVNGSYFKKQILISKPKALELCLEGNVVNFKVELFGRNYTGTLTYKNGIPSYKINETNDIIGNQESIILGALMNGTWFL